jgi:hypothetical protein
MFPLVRGENVAAVSGSRKGPAMSPLPMNRRNLTGWEHLLLRGRRRPIHSAVAKDRQEF